MEVSEYAALMLAIGLSANAAATLVYGGMIEKELVASRDEGDDSRPRPVAVPSLHAMGLEPTATLEEVDQAYRERELTLRPDRGSDGPAYRRLQRELRAGQEIRRTTTTNNIGSSHCGASLMATNCVAGFPAWA